MSELSVYASLFLIAFLAATVLPAQSELGLAALVVSGSYPPLLLITAASVGNTLGSVVNWLLGRGIERYSDRPWFPVKQERLARASRWYHRYGRWSLLLSWMPIVGDPLTLAAGVLREPFSSFFFLVAIAKTTRYIVIAMIAMRWI